MAEWSIAALRTILSTETDAGSDINEELMSQIRENIEAILMLVFYTGDDGSLTADPPDSTAGTITDAAGGYDVDEYNGCVVVITSGTAEGNIYQIDDTTATTLVCTEDNLYSDGVRSGDTYKVFFDLKNAHGHAHDGIDSAVVELADLQVTTAKIALNAITEPLIGPGAVDQTGLGASACGTSELKTGTSSGDLSSNGYATMTGGLYSFYPQTYDVGLDAGSMAIICDEDNTGAYGTQIVLTGSSSGTLYWRNYYVASSGERHWIFQLREKSSGRIQAQWESSDHPSYGNGSRPDIRRHPFGPLKKKNNIWRKMNKDGSKTDCDIIVICPDKDQVERIIKNQCVDREEVKTFFESLNEIYEIDELSSPSWNDEPVTVGLPRLDENGNIIGDYRFASKTKITPIRRAVQKPVVMNHLQLKDKK